MEAQRSLSVNSAPEDCILKMLHIHDGRKTIAGDSLFVNLKISGFQSEVCLTKLQQHIFLLYDDQAPQGFLFWIFIQLHQAMPESGTV